MTWYNVLTVVNIILLVVLNCRIQNFYYSAKRQLVKLNTEINSLKTRMRELENDNNKENIRLKEYRRSV